MANEWPDAGRVVSEEVFGVHVPECNDRCDGDGHYLLGVDAGCASPTVEWCYDGTCSGCVGGHLVSEFVFQHADDRAECLWDAGDQAWFQMHPLYPTRPCTRLHMRPRTAPNPTPAADESGAGA